MIRAVEFIDETLNLVFIYIYFITVFALFIIVVALLNVNTYHIIVVFNIV